MKTRIIKNILAAGAATALLATAALAADFPVGATAQLQSMDGKDVGTVQFSEGPNGLLLHVVLHDLPAGVHAFHIHTMGKCMPNFDMAGGHFNPTKAHHGFMAEGGPHLGDMPNITIPASGSLTFDQFLPHVTLNGENPIFDADGSSVMIHAGADDYKSDPSGDAGARLACGAIVKAG